MNLIKEITSQETFKVRQPVLRKGKSIESCQFDGDNLNSTKHFGYFYDGNLIGIISLFKSSNENFKEKKQYQVRGMAVLENHQKKGIGESLVIYVEKFLEAEGQHLIWFNARESAVGFYEKLGYRIIGEKFEINGVGPHFLMSKNRNNLIMQTNSPF